MNIEEILECDADTLEKMTDAQLLEHFKQYLPTTRPEYAPKRVSTDKKVMAADPKVAQTVNVLKGLGINLDPKLLRFKKK